MKSLLYRLGKYLCARFGDEVPQPVPPAPIAPVLDAYHVAEIVLHKLTEHLFPKPAVVDPGPPAPPPVPPAPEPIERNLPRVVAATISDIPDASLKSIHDRAVKALARLHPEEGRISLVRMVYDELRRNGIV